MRFAIETYAVCLTSFLLINIHICVGEDLIDQIELEGASHAQRLGTIQFRSQSSDGFGVQYYLDGNRFRVEEFDPSNPIPRSILSYNGANYFALMSQSNVLGVGKSCPPDRIVPLTRHPMFLPYYWLVVSENTYTWEVVCSISSWKKLLEHAVIGEEPSLYGMKCYALHFKNPKIHTEILFSSKPLGFPMRWRQISELSGAPISMGEVSEYKILEAESGALIVPTCVTYSQQKTSTTLEAEVVTRVLPDSLAVNKPVDAEVFTLHGRSGTEIVDLDHPPTLEEAKRSLLKAKPSPSPEPAKPASWLIWTNVALVVTLLGLILRRSIRLRWASRL